MTDKQEKIEHGSSLDDIEKRLVRVFDVAASSSDNHSNAARDRALFATAAAELAQSIVLLRQQREFEGLSQSEKRTLKMPMKSKNIP